MSWRRVQLAKLLHSPIELANLFYIIFDRCAPLYSTLTIITSIIVIKKMFFVDVDGEEEGMQQRGRLLRGSFVKIDGCEIEWRAILDGAG